MADLAPLHTNADGAHHPHHLPHLKQNIQTTTTSQRGRDTRTDALASTTLTPTRRLLIIPLLRRIHRLSLLGVIASLWRGLSIRSLLVPLLRRVAALLLRGVVLLLWRRGAVVGHAARVRGLVVVCCAGAGGVLMGGRWCLRVGGVGGWWARGCFLCGGLAFLRSCDGALVWLMLRMRGVGLLTYLLMVSAWIGVEKSVGALLGECGSRGICDCKCAGSSDRVCSIGYAIEMVFGTDASDG